MEKTESIQINKIFSLSNEENKKARKMKKNKKARGIWRTVTGDYSFKLSGYH